LETKDIELETKDIELETKDIANDDAVIEWLDIVEAKPNTSRNYVLAMKYLSNKTRKTPTQLLEEARDEIRKGVLPGDRSLKNILSASETT
jgi:hypothetical protein